jgi:heme exporter protein CcmD
MDLQNFIAMGKYGAYIWPCYGLTFVVLVWLAWSARRGLREQILHARRRAQAQQETSS